jgi:hypothetical protein
MPASKTDTAAEPYLANLPALWAADPATAAAVEAVPDDAVLPTEPTRDGQLTVAVPMPDGRPVYLHSRHRPLDEAERLAATVDATRSVYHVFGLGLGYHLEQLFDRAGDEAIFLVFEPDLAVVRTALERRDLSRLIDSRRVLLFTRADKGELFQRLAPHTTLVTLGTADVAHAASVRRDPAFYRQVQGWLAEFASFAMTNLNTAVLNGRRTLENVTRNLARYAASPGPDHLRGAYQGYPALIVSAGPSLRRNKHLIRSMVGRAVIIAVQTTLRPLLELGVEPDFVTALDYHDICARYFEGLPRTLSTELVAEPKATPAIFDLHPGPLTLAGNADADALLRGPGAAANRSRLPSGSTVAHLAYYLAEHLGCDPIIFVGQDLGFGDGLYYAPGTTHEDVWRPELGRFCTVEMKQWEQIVRERPILRRVPDQQGRPIYTDERMFTYLQQFERDFSRTTTTIIDATEGGAAKRGTTVMTLAEAIERHCTRPLPPRPRPAAGRPVDLVSPLRARRAEAEQIADVCRRTLPLLEQLRDHLGDQPRVNRLIADIDRLRAEMNGLGATYDLVTQMTQQTEVERFRADRRIAAQRLTGVDRQREQVARDVENVRGVAAAAADFIALLDEVAEAAPAAAPASQMGVAA